MMYPEINFSILDCKGNPYPKVIQKDTAVITQFGKGTCSVKFIHKITLQPEIEEILQKARTLGYSIPGIIRLGVEQILTNNQPQKG